MAPLPLSIIPSTPSTRQLVWMVDITLRFLKSCTSVRHTGALLPLSRHLRVGVKMRDSGQSRMTNAQVTTVQEVQLHVHTHTERTLK